VKNKKQNSNIRDLFRQNLENAEVIPDVSIKSRLMRHVGRKEFMRFNPSRFNIFYLGGVLVAAITTALIIVSASKEPDNLKSLGVIDELIKSDSSTYLKVADGQSFRKEAGKSIVNLNESTRNTVVPRPHDQSGSVKMETAELAENSNLIPSEPNKLFTKNSLFTNSSNDRKKLQRGFRAEESLIDPFTSAGCAPFKLQFHNKSVSYDSCKWTFGDGGYSNEKDPEWIFDVDGEYNVVLQVFIHDGNVLTSSASVKVYPRPQVRFEISPEKAILPNDEIHFLNYSTDAVRFKWDFGDGTSSEFFEPKHTYAKFSNYNVRLVAVSDLGCSDSLTVLNAFSGSGNIVDFPNAFIPNMQGPSGGYYSSKSDEAAQVFHPSYTGVSEYQLRIFSKLGVIIFESNDINIGWDGYNKGELCEPGVYIWKVRGKFRNGEPFIKMGDVTLLKN
jgi:hypothetical protein